MLFLRHFRAFALAVAVTTGAAHAQGHCPPPAIVPTQAQWQAAQFLAKDRSFLWRATKDGRSSYLYGTIHIAKLDWVFPGPEMRKALQATEALAAVNEGLLLLENGSAQVLMAKLAKAWADSD